MPRSRVAIDDSRLAVYRELSDRIPGAERQHFIVEGKWLVERLIDSRFDVVSVLGTEEAANSLEPRLGSTPLLVVDAAALNEIAGFKFHRGVMACGLRQSTPQTLEFVVDRLSRTSTIVICDNVVDQQNLGGILRNCAAFGVDAIILAGGSADPFSRRVIRVSMGDSLGMTVIEPPSGLATIRGLREKFGYEIVATVLQPDADSLAGCDRAPRTAIVFGNEGHGLDSEWLNAVDRRVTLPMQGSTDSLNVATASGVFLYHFCCIAKAR